MARLRQDYITTVNPASSAHKPDEHDARQHCDNACVSQHLLGGSSEVRRHTLRQRRKATVDKAFQHQEQTQRSNEIAQRDY